MSTGTNHACALGTEPALRGILALLVAERQEREDRGIERAEQILGRAGLGDEQIASHTGRDANQVRAIVEDDGVARSGARPQSVIDQARETRTRNVATRSASS